MAGTILQRARTDAKRHISAGGFEEDITLTANDVGATTVEVKGLTTKHHLTMDTDGQVISSLKIHVTVIESQLTALSYPVRNSVDEVAMEGHRVDVADATGTSRSYVVLESFPDEHLGTITLILGDYNA